MKKIVIAALLLCLKMNVYSQTLATDFNINDCAGTPHHLFNELDSGKVIVLCFVMPCVGCISPSEVTSHVVANFPSNKVYMYLVDDDGDNGCSLLYGWRNANGLGLIPTFSDPAVVQGQYGTPGMPKIVVLGGSGHYVYDNENNVVDSIQLTNAINAAITGVPPASTPNSVHQAINISALSLSPNPARDRLTLNCDLMSASEVRMDIFDAAGIYVKTVIKERQPAGHRTFAVETDELSSGNYILKLQAGDAQQALKFSISK